MAIDAMIDRFRVTGCAYAIDGKQGGRLLSPLQQVDYRDFATNPQDWGTSWADAIGASEGWEVDVTARYYTVSASTLIFGRGTGSFMMQTTASGVLCGFFCVDLQATSTWTVESAFTNKVIPVVWTTLVGVIIKREIFPIGEFHAFKLVRGDGFLSLYFDDALVATCNCTLIDNKPFNSLTNDGNIQSITLKNAAGNVVWQAPQSELYSGWLLKPLAQDSDGATFEIKQGLIQYGDDTVSSDNSGNLVSSNSTVLSRRIYVPVDLRGYSGDFSIMWEGDNTSNAATFAQAGGGGAIKVTVQFVSPTTTTQGYVTFGNGTTNATTYIPSSALPPGKNKIIVTVNRAEEQVHVYANGELAASGAIPLALGALNPDATETNLTVRLIDGLSRFAFWPRALSAEEVAAL